LSLFFCPLAVDLPLLTTVVVLYRRFMVHSRFCFASPSEFISASMSVPQIPFAFPPFFSPCCFLEDAGSRVCGPVECLFCFRDFSFPVFFLSKFFFLHPCSESFTTTIFSGLRSAGALLDPRSPFDLNPTELFPFPPRSCVLILPGSPYFLQWVHPSIGTFQHPPPTIHSSCYRCYGRCGPATPPLKKLFFQVLPTSLYLSFFYLVAFDLDGPLSLPRHARFVPPIRRLISGNIFFPGAFLPTVGSSPERRSLAN